MKGQKHGDEEGSLEQRGQKREKKQKEGNQKRGLSGRKTIPRIKGGRGWGGGFTIKWKKKMEERNWKEPERGKLGISRKSLPGRRKNEGGEKKGACYGKFRTKKKVGEKRKCASKEKKS